MTALGKHYDIGLALAPVDLSTAGATGKRIWMGDCTGVDIVLVYGAGTDGDDPVPSVQQHTAYTGGTSANLVVIDTIYRKAETLLDNDEAWVKTTQTAATIMTAVADDAQKQKVYVIPVSAASLSDGYGWISVNQADLSNNAQLAAFLYIKHGLKVKRTPPNCGNLLNPGASNA
ncbi:MAG: hypothetical protein ACOYEV_19130 [Candidatus Nanopelagicales bacterium]